MYSVTTLAVQVFLLVGKKLQELLQSLTILALLKIRSYEENKLLDKMLPNHRQPLIGSPN